MLAIVFVFSLVKWEVCIGGWFLEYFPAIKCYLAFGLHSFSSSLLSYCDITWNCLSTLQRENLRHRESTMPFFKVHHWFRIRKFQLNKWLASLPLTFGRWDMELSLSNTPFLRTASDSICTLKILLEEYRQHGVKNIWRSLSQELDILGYRFR